MLERQLQSERGRWTFSAIASVLCHILIGVWFGWQAFEKPLPMPKKQKALDIVLLQPSHSVEKVPEKNAKEASRAAKAGSGDEKVFRQARAPIAGSSPQPPSPDEPSAPPPKAVASAPEANRRPQVLSRKGPEPDAARQKPTKEEPEQRPEPERRTVPLQNLMPSSQALAQLSRDIMRERRLQSMLSREADVPINTKESKYAPYAQQLVRALEDQWRPSEADYFKYMEEARQVLMKITIESNGDLSRLEVIRASPIAGLTESAEAAVHAASPFRPLPSSWGLDRVSFYLIFEVVDNRFVFRTG